MASSAVESVMESASEDDEEALFKKCRSVFQLFERGSGSILTKDLGSALRALGQIPSDQEVEIIASKLEQDELYDKGHTKVTFEEFCQVVQDNSERKDDIKEMVVDSFKALDPKGTGLVEAAQLTSLLTGMGETLSHADMKELLQEAGVSREGKIDYMKFVEQLMQFEAATADTRSAAAAAKKPAEDTKPGKKP